MYAWVLVIWMLADGNIIRTEVRNYHEYSYCMIGKRSLEKNLKDIKSFIAAECTQNKDGIPF